VKFLIACWISCKFCNSVSKLGDCICYPLQLNSLAYNYVLCKFINKVDSLVFSLLFEHEKYLIDDGLEE
jgi:hypothetical protein